MNELKDLLEDLQDYFSNKSDAETVEGKTVANVEYMLAQRIAEQLASPSEEELKEAIELLHDLCGLKHYKDQVGKDSYYEKSKPIAWEKADEFLNKMTLRSSSEQELKENFKWSSWLRSHTSTNQTK
jgi:exoribonuclease R